ncbi:Protein of unknown function [Thalassobacillus cyri]|uniref:DUF3891 domain-containing protein n=1 Tax=Thalassobacillus cyri TaxID=571932 RepID=A0A1H3X1B1_9BACI|nr:DUF3891 family protein [Thalassobacillus cyri]SDZ93195.1 Protein of unknown function [Thalassobacillus cyri]
MIVNQSGDNFIMMAQHDHAQASGKLVDNWKQDFIMRSKLRQLADWAVGQHDRAWIPLDKHPKWNEDKNRPYTFVDYPLKEKLDAYVHGIDDIEKDSYYAAVLCSRHYSSFFPTDSHDPDIKHFLDHERKRRSRLKKQMDLEVPRYLYDLHFKRLQFCDDLSLYICMQEPGVAKEEELSWFKNGFRQTFDFAPQGMISNWLDKYTVSVAPFPFERPFELSIPYKLVTMEAIDNKGLQQAWDQADVEYRHVKIIPGK